MTRHDEMLAETALREVRGLGTAEAVRRLYVENFPVTVIIDSEGNNLYEIGRQNYLDSMRQREACGSGVWLGTRSSITRSPRRALTL